MTNWKRIKQAFGLWRCRRGHHAPLRWERMNKRKFPITNQPLEMMAASGFLGLIKENGWCPRCGLPVEWRA